MLNLFKLFWYQLGLTREEHEEFSDVKVAQAKVVAKKVKVKSNATPFSCEPSVLSFLDMATLESQAFDGLDDEPQHVTRFKILNSEDAGAYITTSNENIYDGTVKGDLVILSYRQRAFLGFDYVPPNFTKKQQVSHEPTGYRIVGYELLETKL